MSVLVEIAELADVSVEGVVRVLTREPVSDAVKERVLAVLDELGPEQTRAVQRFALAALHDVLPRPEGAEEPETDAEAAAPEPPATPEPAGEAPLPAVRSDAVLAELGTVLGELADAVRDLKAETLAERRERVDDLAVLIDLVTTGWQRVDGHLGRIERRLERFEARPRAVPLPPPAAPPPVPEESPAAVAEDDRDEVEPPPPAFLHRVREGRAPMVAATLAGGILGGLAVLQLVSGDAGADRLAAVGGPAATAPGTAIRPAPTTRPSPPATTTAAVLGTTTTQRPTRTAPAPAPAGSRPAPTAPPPAAATTTAPPPATTAAAPRGFQPTRNWAWAPVPGADYYSVEFLREGKPFYRATPKEARLTLPDSLRFSPGAYRWIVRPGYGAPAARDLGDAVVDSPFAVAVSR